jgi:hypothetical protein
MEGVMEGTEKAASPLRAEAVGMEAAILKKSLDLSHAVIMAVVVVAMGRGLGVVMCAPLFYYCWQNNHRMAIT